MSRTAGYKRRMLDQARATRDAADSSKPIPPVPYNRSLERLEVVETVPGSRPTQEGEALTMAVSHMFPPPSIDRSIDSKEEKEIAAMPYAMVVDVRSILYCDLEYWRTVSLKMSSHHPNTKKVGEEIAAIPTVDRDR